MATSITIAQALAYEQDPSQIPPNTTFEIIDTAANIDTLNSADILGLSSLLNVTSITATDAPVTFTPGGAEQAALTTAGIDITAHISASEAIALEKDFNASGAPVLVPPDENLIVVDTAAHLEALTPHQLLELGKVVDTASAVGNDTGTSAITEIAGTNAPPVFDADQVSALSKAGVVIVAPARDPGQNDGTTVITGRGMTFDITWDSSVASAPAEFKTDVEEVAQMYADTYSSAATIYVNVGFGELAGSAIDPSDLGENEYFSSASETYANLTSQLATDATSPAQLQALSTLPATDPNSPTDPTKTEYSLSPAQAQTLGFADAPTSSAADPDGFMGFSSGTDWNFSADPNQTPVANEYDFIGSVEHELSEIMGRSSAMADFGGEKFDGEFSVLDLYRYQGAGDLASRPRTDPSYFSIDGGVTDLADFNNFKTGNNGDLGDWSGTTVGGTLKHTPDSFNDNSDPGIINPFTTTDATLMNVLGYNFTSAPTSPIPLLPTDIAISAGQLLMDLTLDEINPGSADPPPGDSYVVVDTAFDLESLTAPEIRQAVSIGVREFISDGSIAFLQNSDDHKDNQVAALGHTPFIAVLTAAEAVAAEADPPSLPAKETVVVADTAANIEALTKAEVDGLATISATEIDVSDLSGTGRLVVQDGYTYAIHGAVTPDEKIHFAASGGTLEFDDTADMKGTISGLKHGDRIVLSDVGFDTNGSVDLLAGNVLEVTENGVSYDLQLNPKQDFAGEFFHLHADPGGGTDIVENRTPCYCRGTLIQAEGGRERVENLGIGDNVMTRSGVTRPIKWIGRRSFSGRFVAGRKDILPICIKAGALEDNVPRRDLWISPHHAMYFQEGSFAGQAGAAADHGGVLIEAKDLVNGHSILQAESVDMVEYFHIELDTHDVIVAEGALSESFLDDDSRAMFHNAHEFRVLYPDAAADAAHYCAPRLDAGYEVDAVRQCIERRAGLSRPADTHRAAPLRGYIDAIGEHAIEGWAQNCDAPEAPVCLDIFVGERRLGEVLANRFREDLAAAGLGSGRHAFSFELPAGQTLGTTAVEVRRSLDGRRLEVSDSACRQRRRRQ